MLVEPADDLVGRLRRREPVQPAVVVVEAARLVDRHQHRQIVHPRQARSPPGAAPGRDVDDPGPVLERDLVPRDHAVLDRRARAELVERPGVAPADELLAAPALGERLVGIRARPRPTRRSRAARTRPRAAPRPRRSPAASRASSSRSRATRRLARAAGSARRATGRRVPGRRPTARARAAESEVPQRGHHSVERWPSGASLARGRPCRKRQMYSMFVSLKVK